MVETFCKKGRTVSMNRKKPKKQHYFVPKERNAEQTMDEELKDMIEVFGDVKRISLGNEQSEGDCKPYRDESELFSGGSIQNE
jgi:hypothetical protein